jgi:hypothetical protein
MSWIDRLLPATYISPSGLPFTFQYEDVSTEVDKKTATFIFPEVDGAFIQDLGRGGRRFPLSIIISGEDYDITADSFMLALEEKGVGTLIHPKYGTRFVVPVGNISRSDNLISGSNQAIINVSFSETIVDTNFTKLVENIVSKVGAALSLFEFAVSEQFSQNIKLDSVAEINGLKSKLTTIKDKADSAFSEIVKADEDTYTAFQIVKNSLTDSISDIGNYTFESMKQTVTLLRLPVQAPYDFFYKISQYQNNVNDTKDKDIYKPLISSSEPENEFLSDVSFIYSNIAGLCEASVNNEYQTRNDVLFTSEYILNVFDSTKEWIDDNITSLGFIDSGEAYNALLDVITLTNTYLINLAFDLPSEKKIILDQDRNVIELVSELYNDLEKIDFFIQTNNLTCDEIEILPRGKEVVYYV